MPTQFHVNDFVIDQLSGSISDMDVFTDIQAEFVTYLICAAHQRLTCHLSSPTSVTTTSVATLTTTQSHPPSYLPTILDINDWCVSLQVSCIALGAAGQEPAAS